MSTVEQEKQSVEQFSKEMLAKLRVNSYKTHWSDVSHEYLHELFLGEVKELNEAMGHWEKGKISGIHLIRECADVANLAMMISEKARAGKKE